MITVKFSDQVVKNGTPQYYMIIFMNCAVPWNCSQVEHFHHSANVWQLWYHQCERPLEWCTASQVAGSQHSWRSPSGDSEPRIHHGIWECLWYKVDSKKLFLGGQVWDYKLHLPGGMVWGVRVLLTATVMVFGESAVTREVISPSNGKCPPLWLVIGSPFTHYKDDHKGHEYSQAHATYNRIYHVSIIVSTLEK